MARITIVGPDREGSIDVDVGPGESVVVGRRPAGELDRRPARSLTIDHPSVSASHLGIEATEQGMRLVDLGSTNGSLVELTDGAEIRMSPAREVVVRLAAADDPASSDELPDDADYASSARFDESIVRSIDRWVRERGRALRVSVAPKVTSDADASVGRIPLASGRELSVDVDSTVPRSFMDSFALLERYVARQNRAFGEIEALRGEGLVVASASMRSVVLRVVDAAASGARSLLVLGPSGSGKEGLARCFHRRAGRAGSFVARNCGLLQKDLARSELFGAEKGAFSGCTQRIVGAVEVANHGTLFLDELGELPLEIQPMLLRFLDRGEYERMGRYGATSLSDTLIVAATNKDLRAAALRGEFRLDLWFRLAGDVVEVPPLRERFEDLIAYLATRTSADGETIAERLTPGARDLLASHRWDGNFRELIQFADRITKRVPRDRIDADACHAELSVGSLRPIDRPVRGGSVPPSTVGTSFEELFRIASSAYRDDHDASLPARWDDVKEFVENYLKPAIFASLSGATTTGDLASIDLRVASQRVGADRGTAQKQLARFFDRYGSGGGR